MDRFAEHLPSQYYCFVHPCFRVAYRNWCFGMATETNCITDNVGQARSSRAQHVSEPGVYMELHPRPSEGQSRAPAEYQTLQGSHMTSGYYNVGFKKGNRKKDDEES